MLKSHLDMIGRNEPIQRKARFWQSYVRALKGTDDMRAPERSSSRPRGIFRPLLTDYPELGSSWPYNKSIYDDPTYAVDRIAVPGYRYLPVSRETYGYSPRNLYPTPYRPGPYYCLSKSKRDLEESVRRADTAEDLYRTESVISNKIALAKHNSEVKNIEEKRKSALYYLPTGDPWWSVYSKIKPHKVLEVPAPESPLKDIYHWKDHPFRALGPTSRAFYYYLWRRSVWEDKLADFDYKVRDTYSPPAHLIYV